MLSLEYITPVALTPLQFNIKTQVFEPYKNEASRELMTLDPSNFLNKLALFLTHVTLANGQIIYKDFGHLSPFGI